jgi:preprotein translocase subunit YajC
VDGDPGTQGCNGTSFAMYIYIYINMYIITIPKEKNKKETTGRVKGMTIGQSLVLGTGAECMLLS